MDALLIKPVSLAQLAETLGRFVVCDEAPQRQFDIRVLHTMTQANEVQMQNMLAELWKNLTQERELLEPATIDRNWKSLSASLHRLKGVACLINAVPLAKRCAQLDGDVQAQVSVGIDASWQGLDASIAALLLEIQAHLIEAPSL